MDAGATEADAVEGVHDGESYSICLDYPTMSDITCTRCGQTREGLASPPFPTELGQRILGSICQVCWKDWLKQQTSIINHYALDLRNPEARRMLTTQTETFLFGTVAKS